MIEYSGALGETKAKSGVMMLMFLKINLTHYCRIFQSGEFQLEAMEQPPV